MKSISFTASDTLAPLLEKLMRKHAAPPRRGISTEVWDQLDIVTQHEANLVPLIEILPKTKITVEVRAQVRTTTPEAGLIEDWVVGYMGWFALQFSWNTTVAPGVFGPHLRVGKELRSVGSPPKHAVGKYVVFNSTPHGISPAYPEPMRTALMEIYREAASDPLWKEALIKTEKLFEIRNYRGSAPQNP